MGTMQNQHLQQDPHTNHHFPSTHPRSPTHHNLQQQLAGPSRLHPGSDGDDGSRRESGGIPPDYEYGSVSRPQSRRLTVMELCNDTNPDAGTPSVLSGPGSRPTTSSGLAASASTLALVDRASRASSQLLGGTTSSAAGTSNDNGGKDNHGDIDNNGDIGNNGGNDNDKAADNARGTGAGWTRAEAGKGDKVRPIRMFF